MDENKCIGCGVCTTKCAFDAIHLERTHPEATHMIRSEDKFSEIIPYQLKRAKAIAASNKAGKAKEPGIRLTLKSRKGQA